MTTSYTTGKTTTQHIFQTGIDNVAAVTVTAVYTDSPMPESVRIRQHSTSGVVRIPTELLTEVGALLVKLGEDAAPPLPMSPSIAAEERVRRDGEHLANLIDPPPGRNR